VSEAASGSQQLLHWVSHVEGMLDRNVDAVIDVSGNLLVAPIDDQKTVVNNTLAGIPVVYHDNDAAPNQIGVTGAHISAVVHGNAPGDSIDLIPETDFVGTTTVTVTVTDTTHPFDAASTTFQLTVLAQKIFADGFGG